MDNEYMVFSLVDTNETGKFLSDNYRFVCQIYANSAVSEIADSGFFKPDDLIYEKNSDRCVLFKSIDKIESYELSDTDRTFIEAIKLTGGLAMDDKNSGKRLFLDMDGTLAKFHDEDRYLERMFEKDFFKELKPFQNLVDGVKLFSESYPEAEIFIISAYVEGEPPYCQQEKHEWISKHLPEIDISHRIFTPMGCDKSEFIPGGIGKNDFLLDDYNKNLEQFQTAGGSSIKCKNNINHKGLIGPLWQGGILDNAKPPDAIADNLSKLMELPQKITVKKEMSQGELEIMKTDVKDILSKLGSDTTKSQGGIKR